MSKKYYKTDQLFPRTSFIIGVGSVFNIVGNYYEFNGSESEAEADCRAIESDWGAIGNDLHECIYSVVDKDKKITYGGCSK